MFFKKANILFAGCTILILATLGGSKTGNANKLVIEQINLFPDEMKVYSRAFMVTSNVHPASSRTDPIVMPQMIWPTDTQFVSSGYGYRNSCDRCSSFHEAADFTPGEGMPVYSSMDGIVSKIEHRGGYGLYVVIEHIAVINTDVQRWETLYAHLQKDSVPEEIAVGSLVSAGTIIGAVGKTGVATGPHLHFEVRVSGEKKDPLKYLQMYAN